MYGLPTDGKVIFASKVGLAANVLLFLLKLAAGLISNSISVISDAFNSLSDIITSIAIHKSVKMSSEKPDIDHPFGHSRAEPLAGLLVSILAALLGFSVVSSAFNRFFSEDVVHITTFTFFALIITLLIKLAMSVYFHKIAREYNSPAIKASEMDCKNDLLVTSAALFAITAIKFSTPFIDAGIAFLIGLEIIWSGYNMGKRNIDFLIGKAPDDELVYKIQEVVSSINEVLGVHDVRAHYVGSIIQVEVHIILDKNLSLVDAHKIGKDVQKKLEELPLINRAFVHIDPE